MKDRIKFKSVIIDNDRKNIQSLKNILLKLNCVPDVIKDKNKAGNIILYRNYDFYFINISLDDINISKKIIDWIKEFKFKPFIIAMTFDTSSKTEALLRSYGISYFLKRPFLQKEIETLIRDKCNIIINKEMICDNISFPIYKKRQAII